MNNITTHNTQENRLGTVIDAAARFSAAKCPVGNHALHSRYGMVEVLDMNGSMRTVHYEEKRPMDANMMIQDLPAGVHPWEVLEGEQTIYGTAEVDVTELTEMDVRRDLNGERGPIRALHSIQLEDEARILSLS